LFFLRGVAIQSQDTLDQAKKLQDLQITWENILEKNRTSVLTLSAARILFDTPLISANLLVERFGITHQAAMNIIRRLEDLQMVQEMTGRKRDRLYHAPAILQIVR
jgi:ribosomal protein S25